MTRNHAETDETDSTAPETSASDGHPAQSEMDRDEYVDEAQDYERAPEGFEADWSEDDTKVPDDPVIVDVDGQGEASAYLVAWAVVDDLQDEDTGEFGAEQVAEIIRDHYVSPSFDALDAQGVRQMRMAVPDALLDAIMPGMTAEMNADGSAQVDAAGNK